MQAVERKDITAKALQLVEDNVRFRPYGRDPYAENKRIRGVDCIGVVMWIGEQFGLLKDVEIPPYAFPPQREVFNLFDVYMTEIDEPREAAVVVFQTREGAPLHCGLLMAQGERWLVIGIAPHIRRPYVIVYPMEDHGLHVWKYYDFKADLK